MLDSLLTLTKGAAAWMAGALVVCLLMDRAISAVSGVPVSIFMLFALLILFVLVVTGAYTAGKWVWHRVHHAGA
ncbi:MAG TPA: hypothetical protein VIL41_04330 [Coriobacteriia bacterium]